MTWWRNAWCSAAHVKVGETVWFLGGELAGIAWHCTECDRWYWRAAPYPPDMDLDTPAQPRRGSSPLGRIALIGTALAAGVLLVTAVFARPWLGEYASALPEGGWVLALGTGLALIVASALLRATLRVSRPGLRGGYQSASATFRELRNIHTLAVDAFGPDVSPLARMREWHRKNPTIFKVIYRLSGRGLLRKKERVGYYCMIPLKARAVDKLRRGAITGATFQTGDIAGPNEKPAAVYVGGIVARGWLARGNTQFLWAQELAEDWPKRTQVAYTRPVSPEGARLAQRYGFEPIDARNAGKLDALYARTLNARTKTTGQATRSEHG